MLRHIRHVGYAQLDEERDEEREREARASHQRNATQRNATSAKLLSLFFYI